MKPCPNCGEQINDTAKFCKYCGKKVEEKKAELFCEECGALLDPKAPFCEECGAKIGGNVSDDPWAEVDGKSDDPWASFADYKEPETIVVEKPVEVVVEKVIEKVVEKPVEIEKVVVAENKDDLQDAINAFHRKDYAFALSVFERLANSGNAKAQYWFGFCYRYGRGVSRSYAKARGWFQKSAGNGDPDGQLALAELYVNAYGVAKDIDMAESLFVQAASTGVAEYQYQCGNFYYLQSLRGNDERQRRYGKQAGIWFLKAGEQGHHLAWNDLAHAYAEGFCGFAKDAKKALYWNEKGIEANDAVAQATRGEWYEYSHHGVFSKDLSKAKEWYRKAATQGHEMAQYRLKRM